MADLCHLPCGSIGAIGIGGRGTAILKQAAKFGEVVAVCDVDQKHAERAKELFGGRPDTYQDYRRLLERKDVDVIINGTPDHWHTAINIAACRAGKDLYTEKPLTLTIDEGKQLAMIYLLPSAIVFIKASSRATFSGCFSARLVVSPISASKS